MTTYKSFRKNVLRSNSWNLLCRLGAKSFQTPMWDFNVQLVTLTNKLPENEHSFIGLDISEPGSAEGKQALMPSIETHRINQLSQLDNPDAMIQLEASSKLGYMRDYINAYQGLSSGDDPRLKRTTWEIDSKNRVDNWEFMQGSCQGKGIFSGRQNLISARVTTGALNLGALRGRDAWNKKGISIDRVASLYPALYQGDYFHSLIPTLIPKNEDHLAAIWAFASSEHLVSSVRQMNQSLSVDNGYFERFQVDIEHWVEVANMDYPNGLPLPYSDDQTQWIFHGHPCASVVWDEQAKKTSVGELRQDDTVLQVAIARLLGYQWPAELDPEMELAPEMLQVMEKNADFASLVDDDGIVCIPAVRGEKTATKRLEAILYKAYGDEWTSSVEANLLKAVKATDLESWLRDKFFDQHSKLFQHRPFIWQIGDGLKDGFSALVNYHQLDYKGLERLIYTYLDDWISTQKRDLADGKDGADIRLTSAENLKEQLEAILEGEKGLDIFVRWKPLAEQPIGWNPDLNDGVRLNIRPFMLAKDVGKKGAGVLRGKPNIHWKKDRGTDVESAPWFDLGLEYGGKQGDRINDHHLTLAEKNAAKENQGLKNV